MYSKLLAFLLVAFLANQVTPIAFHRNQEFSATEPAETFGAALLAWYKAFQDIMPCGYPPMGIPVLAPFTTEFYSFDFTNGYYNLTGNVSDIMVTGLNNYKFLRFNFNQTTNRTTFDFIVPEVKLLGESAFNFKAVMAGYPTTMANSGLLDMKVIDFRMVGGMTMGPTATGGVAITDFDLNFYIGDAVFNNWNNLWDIAANNFANKLIRESLLMWTQQIQAQVTEIYAQLVLPTVNELLAEVTMTEVIDYLMETTTVWNAADCTL
ncbi:uncharacterized protein LOC106088414 [Stomoxys calcitrans]|uniref:uncharacterized protein LOC106088414 n=1 Tax=Stomoxys calcitrans TaxID=35570 RepID=UPI0027E295C2|nr:uncharacterized protein LOC106088414 [Stomoxys calcitrans]